MNANILVTGAAGYVGGSVVEELRKRNASVANVKIFAAVRSEAQAEILSKKGISAVCADLEDSEAITRAVLQNEINVVVHCASGVRPDLATNLIRALGKREKDSAGRTYFIHTSGAAAFSESGGWEHDNVKDTDNIHELSLNAKLPNPLRQTNDTVIQEAKAHGVTSFILVPPMVYGKGLGEGNKFSICIPRYIKASVLNGVVYKFPENLEAIAVHVSDLVDYYGRLLEGILQGKDLPSDENGYYFIVAHPFHWWETLDRLAQSMNARDLGVKSEVELWPSDEVTVESLGLPLPFVNLVWRTTASIIPVKKDLLQWQPQWNSAQKFLDGIDIEVQDVQEQENFSNPVFKGFSK